MNITPADLKLIADGCRNLIVGIERGETGELLPCRYEKGICFTVRAGQQRTDRRRLTTVRVELSRDRTVPDNYLGRLPRHGAVWVVTFVPGNHEAFFAKHAERYFSKSGVTTDPERAIYGEPAVTTEEELKLAGAAGYRRDMEDEQAWLLAKQTIEAALADLRERARPGVDLEKDIKFMKGRLAKMGRARQERAA